MPSELSGGQQQRVSMARALANNPEIIIADEPTGNLDYQTGQEVMQLLRDLNTKEKKTVVMVTHDLEYLKYANRAIKIFDGRVQATYTESQINDLIGSSQQKRGVGVAEKVLSEQYAKSPEATVASSSSAATVSAPAEERVVGSAIKYSVDSIDEQPAASVKKSKVKQKKT